MRLNDLIDLCNKFKYSQGFYGRLLRDIEEMSEQEQADLDYMIQSANLETELDLIMWVEGV